MLALLGVRRGTERSDQGRGEIGQVSARGTQCGRWICRRERYPRRGMAHQGERDSAREHPQMTFLWRDAQEEQKIVLLVAHLLERVQTSAPACREFDADFLPFHDPVVRGGGARGDAETELAQGMLHHRLGRLGSRSGRESAQVRKRRASPLIGGSVLVRYGTSRSGE